ncbi:MAG TPA: MarR family transcriptional regulator [Burkholderiaceae bacterium]|jgi:DNA-binding MarR family transcriptional regulator
MTSATIPSLCCGTALRKASRRVTQLYDEALAPIGLRSTQYSILVELGRRSREAPSLQTLADALVMDRSALGHTLRPLERDGLLEMQQGEDDRRQRRVVLTAQGQAVLASARPLWLKAQDRFCKVLGEQDAALLRATLLGIAADERLGSLAA